MEDQNNDDMDSLFEGMVLFAPQVEDKLDVNSHSDGLAKSGDTEGLLSAPSLCTLPLDENLFSDLTVITPSHVEAVETKTWLPSNYPSVMTASAMKAEQQAAPAATMFRQSSRKKKRTSLRIGYGRESQLADDPEPLQSSSESSFGSENSLLNVTSSFNASLNVEEDNKLEASLVSSDPSKNEKIDSFPAKHESECINVGSEDIVKSHSSHINTDGSLSTTGEVNISSSTPGAKELRTFLKQEKEEQEAKCDSMEGKYQLIKAQVSEKLRQARQQALSISAVRKDFRRHRRKAAEDVKLASLRFKEIEKKLEEACEAEDFEMAECLSESLAAAEKEKESKLITLKDAEADCDAIDSKMEEALERQIAAEEECVSLLQHFSEDAVNNADLISENIELNSSKEMDEWFASVEAVETKKLELEIESQLVNEARTTLTDSIGHLVEDDVKEKEVLYEKKKVLKQELEELLRLVQEKKAEIAKADSDIEAADKKIAEVAAGFKDLCAGINSKFENLQLVLSQTESECQALSERKEEIDYLLTQGKNRERELRKLAMDCENEANLYQANLRLRKVLVISVLKVREEKLRLAQKEDKILADSQMLKQEISVARVDLQELTSKKSSIQQECASIKQRMITIEKRVPELESEKKVAASARNFKEAARIASEAKSLIAEKENLQIKTEESVTKSGKIEEGIDENTRKLHEFEELVSSKEKEAAVARFQRLRLISAAVSCERSAALELGDLEEANVLLAEAEAADSEAKQLQSLHDIDEKELESFPEQFIPMEFVSGLDGKQLEELVASGNQSPS